MICISGCVCVCVFWILCVFCREADVARRLLQFPYPAAEGSGAAAQKDKQRTGWGEQREHVREPTLKALQWNHEHTLRGVANKIHTSVSVFIGRERARAHYRSHHFSSVNLPKPHRLSDLPQYLTLPLRCMTGSKQSIQLLMQLMQNPTQLLCLHTPCGKY